MSDQGKANETQFNSFADLEAALARAEAASLQAEEDASAPPMFRDIGRRDQKAPAKSKQAEFLRREKPPEPKPWQVARATARLARSYLGFVIRRMAVPRGDRAARARLVRQAFERSGFTGSRVGKQFAMRMDLVSLEVSVELANIDDRKPPMPFEQAMQRVRDAAGVPLDQVYAVIDPEPIASDTLQCIYQGTLIDGRRVAIRVRRPGVRSEVVATVRAMGGISKMNELLGFVRPGFFDSVRDELVDFASEEFDFVRQARQQSVYRKRAEDAKLRWLSAPVVHHRLCSTSVLVSEFVSGVRLSELIEALGDDDHDFLRMTERMGIDPEIVARRLLQAKWWALTENLFFIAQPDAMDVVVQPDNKLMFITFHDCGTFAGPNKRLYGQMMRALRSDDVSSATQSIVQMLSPLPYIDIFDFSKRIEAGLWYTLFALKDPQAPWWERTMMNAWDAVLQVCQFYGVTPRLEVLRMMRATLTTEMMAARLNPDLELLEEFDRHSRKADKRAARAVMEDLRKTDVEDLEARIVATGARVGEGLLRLGLFLETTAENLPVSHLSLSGKFAFAAAELLRLGVLITSLAVGSTLLRQAMVLRDGGDWALGELLLSTVLLPAFLTVSFLLLALTLRRILFRLDDRSSDD